MTVEKSIVGSKVTSAKQLTEGRWYAIGVCQEEYVVHGKYVGKRSLAFGKEHVFEICEEDRNECNKYIYRSDEQIRQAFRGGVFKFKTHPSKASLKIDPKVARELPPLNSVNMRALEPGDRVVVRDAYLDLNVGDIVELVRHDGSNCPPFRKVGTTGNGTFMAPRELAHIPAEVPEPVTVAAPVAPPHPIDVLKSDIDQLVAAAAAKRDEAAGLQLAAAKLEEEAEAKRREIGDALRGYLPGKQPIRPMPLSTGGIDPRPFGKLD